MNKFDVRRQNIARRGELERATIQNAAGVVEDVVLKGSQIVNQIGLQVETKKEQARQDEKLNAFNTLQRDDPNWYFDDNGNALTADQAKQKYEEWSAAYDLEHPPAKSQWAQYAKTEIENNLQKSIYSTIETNQAAVYSNWQKTDMLNDQDKIDSMQIGNHAQLIEQSAITGQWNPDDMPPYIRNNFAAITEAINTEGSDAESRVRNVQENANAYIESAQQDGTDTQNAPQDVTIESVSVKETTDIAQGLQIQDFSTSQGSANIQSGGSSQRSASTESTGTTASTEQKQTQPLMQYSDVITNKNVAAKTVMTYENAINHGYSRFAAEAFARSKRFQFASEEYSQNMAILFENNVLKGNMSEADFNTLVTESLDNIRGGGIEGFSRPLTSLEKQNLKTEVMRRTSENKKTYMDNQLSIFDNQIMPLLKNREQNNGYITSDVFNNLASQYGLDIKWLPEENRAAIESLLSNNDVLYEIDSVIEMLESNAQDINKSAEEKEQTRDQIMSGLSLSAQFRLKQYEDATPTFRRYLITTEEEMISDLRNTFSSLPKTNFLSLSSGTEADTEGSVAFDEIAADPIRADFVVMMAHSRLSNGSMPLVSERILKEQAKEIWFEDLSDERKAEIENTLYRYLPEDAQGLDDYEYRSSDKEINAEFEKWYENQKDWCVWLIENYGGKQLGSSGTTLNKMFSDVEDRLGTQLNNITEGAMVSDDPVDKSEAKARYNELVTSYVEADSTQRPFFQTTYMEVRSSLMPEDQANGDALFMDGDNIGLFNQADIDINRLISEVSTGFPTEGRVYNELVTTIYNQHLPRIANSMKTGVFDPNMQVDIKKTIADYINHSNSSMVQQAIQNTDWADYESLEDLESSFIDNEGWFGLGGENRNYTNSKIQLFTDDYPAYFTSQLAETNEERPIDLDTLRYKTTEGATGAERSDLTPSEQFRMALSLELGFDYSPGVNDDLLWTTFSNATANMSSIDRGDLVNDALQLCAWANTATEIENALGIEFDGFNAKDAIMYSYTNPNGTKYWLKPEVDSNSGNIVDIQMYHQNSKDGSYKSISDILPGNMPYVTEKIHDSINYSLSGKDEDYLKNINQQAMNVLYSNPEYSSFISSYQAIYGKNPIAKTTGTIASKDNALRNGFFHKVVIN